MARPGNIVVTAFFSAGLAVCAVKDAEAQVASGFNLSGLPILSPQLPRPAPLMPQPGGAITAQTVTMPVPPLARATLPTAGAAAAETPEPKTAQVRDEGASHAALDDGALERVR